MYLHYSDDRYADSYSRAKLANIAADLFPHSKGFSPYMPNEGNDLFWTIDQGNDYKIKFFDDDSSKVELVHRYFDVVSLMAEAELLKLLTGADRIEILEHMKKSLDSGDETLMLFDEGNLSKAFLIGYRHNDTFESDYSRKSMANSISDMIPHRENFEAIKESDLEWVLDDERLFRLRFFEDDSAQMVISYEGDQPGLLMAMANWVYVRTGAKRVEFFTEGMDEAVSPR